MDAKQTKGNKMNIYEINQQIEEVSHNMIDYDTGEVLPHFEQLLEALEMDREQKVLNTAKLIKNLEAESKALKDAEKQMADRRKVVENKSKRIKDWIAGFVPEEKIKDEFVSISWRKSESVVIDDGVRLDSKYEVEKITVNPDKVAIKKDLKKGIVIAGCRIVEKQNIQIK